MNWQKKLRNNPALFGVSSHMSLWSNLIFYCSLLINAIGRPSANASLKNFFLRKKHRIERIFENFLFFFLKKRLFLTTFLYKIPFTVLTGLRICITLMQIQIRIQLFTLILTLIRIPLLVKAIRICGHWSTGPPGLHFEPPRLHFERPRPSSPPF